jgi:4a-hydroxytetrahydrobiopterin dehydratase
MLAPSMTINHLLSMHCTPQKDADAQLSINASETFLQLLPGWKLETAQLAISKDYRFPDFHHCMAFVNAIAWIAHREDHHPDLEVGYGHCQVRLSTHDVGGLSINDFICAAKIEALLSDVLVDSATS